MRVPAETATSVATNRVFLGTGGTHPGVDSTTPDLLHPERILACPQGQSVYSMDISPGRNLLAAGTKLGTIHVLKLQDSISSNDSGSSVTFTQGTPILSVCFVDESILATGDTAGRCLFWDVRNKHTRSGLVKLGHGGICAMVMLSNDELLCLSTEGELLWLSPYEEKIVRKMTGPVPPAPQALTNLVYWPTADALVWPADGGNLALYHFRTDAVESMPAHDGDFFSIFTLSDRLLTVGASDAMIRVWQAGDRKSSQKLPIPDSVVSACVLECMGPKLVTVNRHGKASIVRINGSRGHVSSTLPGCAYRAVKAFPEAHLRREHAKRNSGLIQEKMQHAPNEGIDELHSELVQLGYGHVSHALRAQAASLSEDLIGELRARVDLSKELSEPNKHQIRSLERYAELLQILGQTDEAKTVFERISTLSPSNDHAASRARELSSLSTELSGKDAVFSSDVPLATIVLAAEILGKPFSERYVVNELDPIVCHGSIITADHIMEKYENIRADQAAEALPAANRECISWVSNQKIKTVKLITFGTGKSNAIKGLQFGLKVLDTHVPTVATPVVLFDWRHPDSKVSFHEENQQALSALEGIWDPSVSNPWLKMVFKAVCFTLNRLMNLSQGNREGGH